MGNAVRRTIDGLILDSLGFLTFLALLTLFAFLVWGVLLVQDHYYFATTPFTYMGLRVR